MVAEEQPLCTICGIPVFWHQGRLLHRRYGHTDLMLREPFPHEATLDQPQPG